MVLSVVNHDTITRLAFDEKQKQPFGDVLTKRYSKNMQKINRRTPMSKCDFNKVALSTLLRSYFGMVILLYFYCIFSEHLFVSTPLEGYFRKNVSGQDSYSWWCYIEFHQITRRSKTIFSFSNKGTLKNLFSHDQQTPSVPSTPIETSISKMPDPLLI